MKEIESEPRFRALEETQRASRDALSLAQGLSRSLARALDPTNPRGPVEAARLLRQVPSLSFEAQRAFLETAAGKTGQARELADLVRARIATAFPEASERRVKLGAALVSLEGGEPAALARSALEAKVARALARLGAGVSDAARPVAGDTIERARGLGPFAAPPPAPSRAAPPPAGPEPTSRAGASRAAPAPSPAAADLDREAQREAVGGSARVGMAASVVLRSAATARSDRAAVPRVQIRPLAWARHATAVVGHGLVAVSERVVAVEARLETMREALEKARSSGGFADRLQARLAGAEVRRLESGLVALGEPALDVAKKKGFLARLLERRMEIATAREPAGELTSLLAASGRSRLRTAAAEAREIEHLLRAVDGDARVLGGRAGILEEMDGRPAVLAVGETRAPAPAAEAPTEGAPPVEITEEDLARLGSALDPGKTPPQTLWNENMVNLLSAEGRRQGGLSEEQGGKNAELARSLLDPEGTGGPKRDLTAGEAAAALKASGMDLARVDPNQVQAATRYLNTAISLPDQAEKLRKVLDNFQVLDRIGLPKMSREQLMGQLDTYAKVPGKATAKLSEQELRAKFNEVAAVLNGGGELRTKFGKHNLELKVGESGRILSVKCKKPGLFSKIGGALKKIAPIALTVMSFIPVTAPFALAANAAISAYNAIKSRNWMGLAVAAASAVGAGVTLVAGKAAQVAGTMANKVASVANATSRTLRGIQAARGGGVLALAAGIAGSVAGGLGSVAGGFGRGFQGFADRMGNIAGRLSSGLLAADAARRGDYLGAAGLGASLASEMRFTGARGREILGHVADGAIRARGIEDALRRGNYLEAASALSGLAGRLAPGSARGELERTAYTLGQVGSAQDLIRSGDYLGAASAMTAAAGSYTGSAATRRKLYDTSAHLQRAGQAWTRADRGDYLGAAEALTRVVGGFSWDENTKHRLQRAAETFREASGIPGALRSADYLGAASLVSRMAGLYGGEDVRRTRLVEGASFLEQASAAYQLVRRGDFNRAAAILTPLTLQRLGRGPDPLQGTTDLVQAMAQVEGALGRGEFSRAVEALRAALGRTTRPEAQQTLRQMLTALEHAGRLQKALKDRDWSEAMRAADELSRVGPLLGRASTGLAAARGELQRAAVSGDAAAIQAASLRLSRLGGLSPEITRSLHGLVQTEARSSLSARAEHMTHLGLPGLPGTVLGITGAGAVGRAVIDPAQVAAQVTPDVARRLGLPYPLDPARLTPEQAARLAELGEDKGFLEGVISTVRRWSWSDIGHGALDIAGLVPGWGEAADVANAVWYLKEAKHLEAGLSLISVIPGIGDAIGKGGKLVTRLGPSAARPVLEILQRVDVIRFLDEFKSHRRLGPAIGKIQDAVAKWIDELKAATRSDSDFRGVLRGVAVTLPGVKTRTIQYVRRAEAEYKALRAEFDRRIRRDFLRSVADDPAKRLRLREAGLTDDEIALMARGRPPQGWQVHHKIPLDDGGTNEFDNLVLARNDPYHMALTAEQSRLTHGLVRGETRVIEWPMPDGFVYPPVPR